MVDGSIRRRRPEDPCDYCGAAPTRPCRDLRTGKRTTEHHVTVRGRVVLKRRVGQAIWIGDDIRIEVVSTRGSWSQIAIEAPRSIRLVREEVRDRPRHGGDEETHHG